MNISPIHDAQIAASQTSSAVSAEEMAQRRQLIQAVNTVNAKEMFGSENELTFVFDRAKHKTITRVINRDTKQVVLQVPPEYVLSLAEDSQDSSTL